MRLVKQSAARDVMILMVESSDHVTGATGKTLTITASKNGGAFTSISPTVTERSDGWYSIALTSSHTDTAGDFALHITATGCDPSDIAMQVVAFDPADATSLGLSRIDAAISTRAAQTDADDIKSRLPASLVGGRMSANVGAMDTDVITSGALATTAVNEIREGVWTRTDRTLTANPGLDATAVQSAAAAAITAYDPPTKAELDSAVAPLATSAGVTAAVSGLATSSALATVAGYVDTEVAAIKAVTDKIDTALQADGGVYQLTANALELAPVGGGGGGLDAAGVRAAIGLASANLDTQLSGIASGVSSAATAAALSDVASDVTAVLEDTGTSLPAQITGLNNLSEVQVQDAALYALAAYGPATTLALADAVSPLATSAGVTAAVSGLATASQVSGLNDVSATDVQAAAAAALTAYGPAVPGDLAGLATSSAVAALNNVSAADVRAALVDALGTETWADITGKPSGNATAMQMLNALYLLALNKIISTDSQQRVRNSGDTADVFVMSQSDDGTEFVRGGA